MVLSPGHLELAHNGLDRPRTLAPNTLSSHAAIDDTPSPALTPITHSSWKLVQTPAAYEASGFNNRQSLPKTPDHLRMGTEWTTDNTVYEQFVTSTSPGPSTGGSEGGKTKKMRETRIYGYKGNEPEKELKKTKRAQQNREAQVRLDSNAVAMFLHALSFD